MLKLEKVSKNYKVGNITTNVLKDISLSFENNSFVSILGPSGCGKTTLLNILGGLDKPTKGEVLINEQNTKDFGSRKLDSYRNSVIGFIFQNPSLIKNLTVKENVEIALHLSGEKRKERKRKIKEALKKVNIEHLINKKTKYLSGGEQQRVAIARAIVNDPKIILADEPTGALDSKNAVDVMDILKEISKEYLVIMVTHNEELAKNYSDRLIRMKDGVIVSDITNETSKVVKEVKIKKTRMPFRLSLMLSFKNLYSKIIRTVLTAFAGCIGIVGVAMVLNVSDGVTNYIEEVQTQSLESYPIIIRSSTVVSSSGNIIKNREEFPDNNIITITNSVTNYQHVSQISEEFVNYLELLDKDRYTVIDYSRTINFKVLKKEGNSVQSISTTNFNEMIEDMEFFETQYDVIYGTLPQKYNEIALVIDSYNSISASLLNSMGIDYQRESYTFEEIIENKYRIIENNDLYYFDAERNRFRSKITSDYLNLYLDSNLELEITAIIREKPNCSFPLYSSGFLYTTKLTDYLLESANNSDIVIEQRKYGLEKDVQTGYPYEDSEGLNSSLSKEYQYENDLISYGAIAPVTRINIYSQSFDDRNYIESYIKDSKEYKQSMNISYYDYMSGLSKDFGTFIEILTKVLVIFALVSLLVSSIMIAIITYISVLERNKEIGLLRCLGARKIDVIKVFCSETIIIGMISGIFGVILAYILRSPINTLIGNIIKENLSLNVYNKTFIEYNVKTIILLIFGSILITLIAGLIPAVIASFKQPAKVMKNE